MKLNRILFLLIIALSGFQIFCQESNDIDKPDINWHHMDMTLDKVPGISTNRAYDELLVNKKAKKIIIAILDDGLDIEHKDLKENIWTNIDEIPGNGIDDDKNGYIDDIHGWNFLGNSSGENILYDTWEETRTYISLRDQFVNMDTTRLDAREHKQYSEYLRLKKELESKRANIKPILDQWKNSKEAFDSYVELVTKYTKGKKITTELLETLEITDDTLAQEACSVLIQWYKAGYSQQMINKKYNSLRNQYEYNLNPDHDSRSIIGDNPNDLDDKSYGNPNVSVKGTYHGTSVSGAAGAIRSNGFGMDGVTNNLEFMAIRICPYGDERDKDVANAIYYAVDNGAKILNMSFGKSHSPNEAHVKKAIRYAEEKGVLLITGSGNAGNDVDKNPRHPNRYYLDGSECSTWINVGATTRKADTTLVANFSCYGKKNVDIMAPGFEILSLLPANETFLTEGTSISAPIVSGVAALVWSYFPELTALKVKNILLESSEYFGDYEVYLPGTSDKKVLFKELSKTGGIVNAYNAILLAKRKSN